MGDMTLTALSPHCTRCGGLMNRATPNDHRCNICARPDYTEFDPALEIHRGKDKRVKLTGTSVRRPGSNKPGPKPKPPPEVTHGTFECTVPRGNGEECVVTVEYSCRAAERARPGIFVARVTSIKGWAWSPNYTTPRKVIGVAFRKKYGYRLRGMEDWLKRHVRRRR